MLKPLYKHFDDDYIDFWSILGVDFGDSPESIHHKYYNHLLNNNFDVKIDEYYVAFKLLRDKRFEKTYKETKSLKATYDAGFFLDSMREDFPSYLMDYDEFVPVIPFHKAKLDDNKENIVLISTGGFSPVHQGHIHTLEIAKKTLESKGYNVVCGYLSPSHDDYVSTKDNGKAHNLALNRIRLCNEAILDSDWLMTSPLESLYTPTSINYTDVIDAIKQQLRYYFKKDFKIGYVFGGDNAPFIRAFHKDESNTSDIAICISRNHERENIFKENLDNLNYIYIKDNPFTDLSSTKIRNNKKIEKDSSKDLNSIHYLVRNDFHFFDGIDKKLNPISNLISALNNALPDYKIVTVDVNEQIEKAQIDINKNKYPTLSLDAYLKGDFNLEISRIFNISDSQIKAEGFIKRPEVEECFYSVANSLEIDGLYTLIEDDVASGQTLNFVKSILPKNAKLENMILLSDYFDAPKDHFDIVDLRDFIINMPYGGLVVNTGKDVFRVPYIAPFVDLLSRASIPADKVIDFSIEILQMNIKFYESLRENEIEIKLNDQTIKLFNHVGFRNYQKLDPISAIIYYCSCQIMFLSEAQKE